MDFQCSLSIATQAREFPTSSTRSRHVSLRPPKISYSRDCGTSSSNPESTHQAKDPPFSYVHCSPLLSRSQPGQPSPDLLLTSASVGTSSARHVYHLHLVFLSRRTSFSKGNGHFLDGHAHDRLPTLYDKCVSEQPMSLFKKLSDRTLFLLRKGL